MARRKTPHDHRVAIGYIRVSTTEQADSGASLEAQRAMLTAEAEQRGWELRIAADEGVSASSMRRPAMQDALRQLDAGEADFLMAVRLDRISRSVVDFAGLVERAQKRGWSMVLLSPNIDMTDAAGRFTANVLASVAQYERDLISARTREALAALRAQGVRLGRPVALPDSVYRRIISDASEGRSLTSIAAELTDEGVPTARGARWHASTIRRVIHSEHAKTLSA